MYKNQAEELSDQNWSPEDKRRYLIFIAEHISSLNENAPFNFFLSMAKFFQNQKTPEQCEAFHKSMKRKTLEQLVKLIAEQLNENSQIYLKSIKSPEQTEKLSKQNNNIFQEFEEVKSVDDYVLQIFLQNFNPNEIIFRSKQLELYEQEIQGSDQEWSPQLQRSLQSKLYPVKFYSSDNEKNYDFEEQNEMIYENQEELLVERKKKQLISKKIKQKRQEEKHTIAEFRQPWSRQEHLKLIVFLMYYKKFVVETLNNQASQLKQKNRIGGVYNKLEVFIRTRSQRMCQRYIQYRNKTGKIDDFINNLQKSVNPTICQIQEQIQLMKQFILEYQCSNLVAPQQLFHIKINKHLLAKILNESKTFQQFQKHAQHCNQQKQIQKSKCKHKKISIQIPCLIIIHLVQAKENEKETIKIEQIEAENIDSWNKEKHQQSKKQIEYPQSHHLPDSKQQKSKLSSRKSEFRSKSRVKWSILQNFKCIAYVMVNRKILEKDAYKKWKKEMFEDMAKYVRTSKSSTQCIDHLQEWKRFKDFDIKRTIDQVSELWGISKQMIEQRQRAWKKAKTEQIDFGEFKILLDHLPYEIRFNRKELKQQQTIEKWIIQNTNWIQPKLLFYLNDKNSKQKHKESSQELKSQMEKKQHTDHVFKHQSYPVTIQVKLESKSYVGSQKKQFNMKLSIV